MSDKHPHAVLREMVDAALAHATKHDIKYKLELRFPDGFKFIQSTFRARTPATGDGETK